MKRLTTILIAQYLLILFWSTSASIAQTLSLPVSPPAADTNIDLMYTGRLLGYFRVPSLQRLVKFKGCTPISKNDSEPAREFLARRKKYPSTILVGTGDNFSPQLEARIFSDPRQSGSKYAVGNKELYFGNGDDWVFYEGLKNHNTLRQLLASGYGTIPTDNVGCFLRAAHFAAIVPGKHDFYFGAERVRQFARLLAEPESEDGTFKPVQMLGANLVLKTSQIEPQPTSSKITDDLPFTKWPTNLSVSNLTDGKLVYPWFSYVKIQLIDLRFNESLIGDLNSQYPGGTTTLANFISHLGAKNINPVSDADNELNQLRDNADQSQRIKICPSKRPNDIDIGNCDDLIDPTVRWSGTKISLSLTLKPRYWGRKDHFTTLLFGNNYGLCAMPSAGAKPVSAAKKGNTANEPGCLRFATHTPFLSAPHEVTKSANGYYDPEPFSIQSNVAIFGVVDPNLTEQVGILNIGWRNMEAELTSRLSAEDPAEALRQQLDYFERFTKGNFTGLKVLLAQTTPQRAQALAARFPAFQIVVTAADQQQSTSESEIRTVWKPKAPAGTFVAVPSPYFDSSTRQGSVHFGIVKATQRADSDRWELVADNLGVRQIPEPSDPAKEFWALIKKLPRCLPEHFTSPPGEFYSEQAYLKWLVLCAMREETGADVALIQTRDFFEKIPDLKESGYTLLDRTKLGRTAPEVDENIQQTLDRLIWKGDLLTLVYVPGADLRKALKQSAAYAAEETSTFSLAIERGRQLERLGVVEENGDYLINNLPLDDKKVYSVATTDYIGAGDTGYPDLVKAALNPRTHPAAFTGDLVPISSLVCRRLVADPARYCLSPVKSDDYLDETYAAQVPPYEPQSLSGRLWQATGFAWPNTSKEIKSTFDAVEQRVQRRGFWFFSLKNLSFGFKDLDTNRTDQSIEDKFAGIPTSGVTAKESRNFNLALDTRLSYSAYKREFFIAGGIEYERQQTGDPTTPIGISQIRNKLFSDLGFVLWRRPGRAVPNLGAVFSLHGETQLLQPFSTFKLGTSTADPRRITQGRGLLLLGRLGLRWQTRSNSAEFGIQYGREMRALRGYRFETAAGPVECLVTSAQTLKACITANSAPPAGNITADSNATALLQGRPRAGIYWNHSFSIPFSAKVKYEVTQDADFFFVRFNRDTSVDTRFRYTSKNRLGFLVWPNFSIGPTLDLLLFQNKVNGNFLFQRQFGIETKLSFDIFNRREKGVQVQHKP